MSFWKRFSPKRAVLDFADEWRQPTPHRWPILGVAVAFTFSMLMVFLPESKRLPPPAPDVTYISTWSADRTQAEIVASNLANQQRKDEIAALMAERQQQRREAFRALGRASFIDVDALEEQFAEDAAPAETARPAPSREPAPPGER
jgi:hypothetical protein